jgi:ligand-binding SRPBCC domain-containing protein
MSLIHLTTEVDSNIEHCFDLASNVDIHMLSAKHTNESAIAGRTSGACKLDDSITWEARHFGIKQKLTVRITRFERPHFFEDVMISGAFKSMRHEHHFVEVNGKTIMTDRFEYEVPFYWLGKLFDVLILKSYMTAFLLKRNGAIKTIAEKDRGKIVSVV